MKRALLLGLLCAMVTATGCLNPAVVENDAAANKTGFSPRISPEMGDGYVTVVHGVPGLTVDVYVNGTLTLPEFEPGTVTKPLALPEDNYDIVIVPEGGAYPDEAVITGSAFLPAGANASIVAHLAADGTPSLAVFVNDLSPISEKDARVVVRHVAQAGAVDVRLYRDLDDEAVLTVPGLTNPNEAQADVPGKKYIATISGAGAATPLFTSDRFEAEDGETLVVYAIGNPADNTFSLLTQEIDLETFDDDDMDKKQMSLVTVVHGVPGLTVDVYVNGELTIPGFAPGTVTEPLRLPEGSYDIAIVPQGDRFPEDAVITGSTLLPGRVNASIVANLAADGTPSLNVFVNDVSKTSRKNARVVVRHVAQAGAVDVRLFRDLDDDAKVTIAGLTNPNEAQADVRAKKYTATISAAGATDPLFISDRLNLKKEKVYIVYAIGNPADQSFALLLQVIDLDDNDRYDWDDDDRDDDVTTGQVAVR